MFNWIRKILGLINKIPPFSWRKRVKQIERSNKHDRNFFIFMIWAMDEIKKAYEIPDKIFVDLMRRFEANPDEVIDAWNNHKFGLVKMGYDIYPEDEDDQTRPPPEDKKSKPKA